MKIFLTISLLCFGLNSFQQRPDLRIGINAKIKFLHSDLDKSKFIAPGTAIHLHVSKRHLLGGLNLGYSSVFEKNNTSFSLQHLINSDVVIGWIFLRNPTFKMGINAVCSYSVSLNKKNQLNPSSPFLRNSLAILPELYVSYKSLRVASNYNLPIIGTPVSGIGIELGIRF